MSKPEYTISKIYFTIEDIKDFTSKYDKYFLKLDQVYATSTYTYKDVDYYNIQLNFEVNILSEKKFNHIMDTFCEFNTKSPIERATYKYKKLNDEVVHKWTNRNLDFREA